MKNFKIQPPAKQSIFIFSLLLFLSIVKVNAQENHYVIIDTILISGNDHTKSIVIEREMVLKKDSIYFWSEMDELALQSKNTLFNTNLFLSTQVTWQETRYQHITVTVTVSEKWYIWPVPAFELADRNYKQWSEKDFALGRTNFGLYLFTYNFKGLNQTVKLAFINGYTRNIGFNYVIPYLDKQGKYGIDVSSSFKQNKEIWYATDNNKLQFYKNFEKTLIQRFENKIAFITRKNNFMTDRWEVEYNRIKVNDTVVSKALNPKFLLAGNKQSEANIKYILTYEKRDSRFYPLSGYYFKNEVALGSVKADTVSYELVKVTSEFGLYQKINKRFCYSVFFKSKMSNQPQPFIPYYNYKSFGYKDYVRGYEQYVVDGHAFVLAKLNFKTVLMHQKMFTTPLRIHKKRISFPAGVYINFYSDYGKVFNKQYEKVLGRLELFNTDLLGYGTGIDFMVYNDKILRLEYSLNILGDKNFNLHFEKAF